MTESSEQMGAEAFPGFEDLWKYRLDDLPWIRRYVTAGEIAKLIQATLETYGPLSVAALHYYVNKQHHTRFRRDHIIDAVQMTSSPKIWEPYDGANFDTCYRTEEQVNQRIPASVPAPTDFEDAYYTLYDRLQLAREDPQTLYVPTELLKDSGLL